jgi:hypothetical protein
VKLYLALWATLTVPMFLFSRVRGYGMSVHLAGTAIFTAGLAAVLCGLVALWRWAV